MTRKKLVDILIHKTRGIPNEERVHAVIITSEDTNAISKDSENEKHIKRPLHIKPIIFTEEVVTDILKYLKK